MACDLAREALKPIAKIAEFFADEQEWRDHDTIRVAPLENLDEAQHITVGDLRRARTAYDAIGPESCLTIAALQAAHVERQEEWCPDQKPDLSFRGNEMAGEVGEACNVIKKLERERHGWRGSRATTDDLGDELADVVHTAVLCAITAGIELEPRVVAKFNATSEKNGLSTLLSPHTAAGAGPVGEAALEVARIPAEDAVDTVASILALNDGRKYVCGPDFDLAYKIVRALGERAGADRASQEERIREDERDSPSNLAKRVLAIREHLRHERADGVDLGTLSVVARTLAALEAEASEGERRGLERAAACCDGLETKTNRPSRCAAAIRALIPEAPAREGE